jgi:hypothetical protein
LKDAIQKANLIGMSAELGLSEAENTGSSGTRYMNAPYLAEEAKWKK